MELLYIDRYNQMNKLTKFPQLLLIEHQHYGSSLNTYLLFKLRFIQLSMNNEHIYFVIELLRCNKQNEI